MSQTHTWFHIPKDSGFTLQNLPLGIFSTRDQGPRPGIAVGDHILDLAKTFLLGLMPGLHLDPSILIQPTLNPLISQGKATTRWIREKIREELTKEESIWKVWESIWVKQVDATLHMPIQVGDYTDFYSSIEHATNVGKMFRDPENALLPNWRHLPIAYHGRASSIVVSNTPIRRPKGQVLLENSDQPVLQATQKLDFELEMAFVIGTETHLGESISVNQAEEYIFGVLLFNDWSARDIQKWEYVPLGPFLGKNFASSISPWIIPLEALEPFRVEGPVQHPEVLSYLQTTGKQNFNIHLEVGITPEGGQETLVSTTNFKNIYWNMSQQLAQHTVNGCNVRVGDLMASGTISGSEPGTYGSMMELGWNGQNPITLSDGYTRSFLEDGDTVVLRGYAGSGDIKVGLGEVKTTILPPY